MKSTTQLKDELAELQQREKVLIHERAQIAHEALADDNPKAQKQLAAINAELAMMTQRVASMEAAIVTSEQRDEVAAAKARDEQARLNEIRADEFEKALSAHLQAADQHALDMFEELDEAYGLAGELHRLGRLPNDQMVEVAMKQGLKTHSMMTRFKVCTLGRDQSEALYLLVDRRFRRH